MLAQMCKWEKSPSGESGPGRGDQKTKKIVLDEFCYLVISRCFFEVSAEK